jgi:Squalene-hopene cyclase C-terminal domain/Prenyltransferase and squalene oxidase repeat
LTGDCGGRGDTVPAHCIRFVHGGALKDPVLLGVHFGESLATEALQFRKESIMKLNRIRVLVTGVAALAIGFDAETAFSGSNNPVNIAVEKGTKWLASVQGKDGGWGQDGGETSYVRQGEHLESNGNDVANTAVAAEALLHGGREYREQVQRAVEYILQRVEQSPDEGLAVTNVTGTQIQRKLGPYIDTFLTSKLLAELDGTMGDAQTNARVRRSLQKCVVKIEKNQLKDGSWNVGGGWAPILGTSMASRVFIAQGKGVAVSAMAMAKVDTFTRTDGTHLGSGAGAGSAMSSSAGAAGAGIGGGVGSGAGAMAFKVTDGSAGVNLYSGAQKLEQLSRTDADRAKNKDEIEVITKELSNPKFVAGFGSIGGEEFFSYLNISDSLRRTGGPEWNKWNTEMKAKILSLQNADGTWSGQHCITGRVAVTSAAILLLIADRDGK